MTDSGRQAGDERPEYRPGAMIRATPGLLRIAASAWLNAAEWAATGTVKAGSRAMKAAVSGESANEMFRAVGNDARARARSLLGIVEMEDALRSIPNGVSERPEAIPTEEGSGDLRPLTLRERGEELMRRSADVHFQEDAHPAFGRILESLAPDEARILRLLNDHGAQPTVDVRAGLIPLNATSELISAGLNMIGAEAGCRHLADIPAYLNNLFRLGLVWFSREPVKDPLRYQVLEAQPEVLEAMRKGGRGGRTVRRSIHLTPFGTEFYRLCLPLKDVPPSDTDGGEPDPG